MTVIGNTWLDTTEPEHLKIKLYKDIPFCDKKKISFFHSSSSSVRANLNLQIIIDQIKDYFGLESFDRCLVIFPSQEIYMTESHFGYERFLNSDEIAEYDVFKIRLFRWIVGLPHANPKNDIIVRFHNGKKTYISYRDNEIDPDRNMRIEIPSDVNLRLVISEMLYGATLSDIKDHICDIINKIDPNYIFIADSICRKLNLYKLI